MKKRKTIALIIVLGGIAGFFLIINLSGKNDSGANTTNLTTPEGNNLVPSLRFETLSPTAFQNNNRLPISSENLTESLIETYTQEILKRNESGPQVVDNKPAMIMPSEELTSEILINYLNQQKIDFKEFALADIKTDSDTSAKKQKEYLKKIYEITQNNFSDLKYSYGEAVIEILKNNNPRFLQNYISRMGKGMTDLKDIAVPTNWKLFHLQYLNLQQKKLTIYSAIANLNNDPLKALIAVNQLTDLLEEEENLTLILTDKASDLIL